MQFPWAAPAVALALVACSAAKPPPPAPVVSSPPLPVDAKIDAGPTAVEATLARLAELADRMCQCRDSACANRLADEVGAWGPVTTGADGGLSESEAAELAATSERLTRCTADAMSRPGARP